MLDNLRTALRGKFVVAATAFGHHEAAREALERGINQEQRDSALVEAVFQTDSDPLIEAILNKGTTESARDRALYECANQFHALRRIEKLIAQGVSEQGRDHALGKVAIHSTEQSDGPAKIELLIEAGVSEDAMKSAIQGAASAGNALTLNLLLEKFEDGRFGTTIPQRYESEAVRDLKRKDLTIGVEKLLGDRGLLPKP
jgi:hypothetical protein